VHGPSASRAAPDGGNPSLCEILSRRSKQCSAIIDCELADLVALKLSIEEGFDAGSGQAKGRRAAGANVVIGATRSGPLTTYNCNVPDLRLRISHKLIHYEHLSRRTRSVTPHVPSGLFAGELRPEGSSSKCHVPFASDSQFTRGKDQGDIASALRPSGSQ
jgi:hypothetical protein